MQDIFPFLSIRQSSVARLIPLLVGLLRSGGSRGGTSSWLVGLRREIGIILGSGLLLVGEGCLAQGYVYLLSSSSSGEHLCSRCGGGDLLSLSVRLVLARTLTLVFAGG